MYAHKPEQKTSASSVFSPGQVSSENHHKPPVQRHIPDNGVIQRVGEQAFIDNPQGFMTDNQLLVNFAGGIIDTYDLPVEAINAITARQEQVQQEVRAKNPGAGGGMTSSETISRKANEYLVYLYDESMKHTNIEMFTLAYRKIKTGIFSSRGQYVVTPMLEAIPPTIDDDIMVAAPGGGEQVSLKAALRSVVRKSSQPYDRGIRAALIPYESNPADVTENTKVDIPAGTDMTGPKIAFTAGMNGCSIAVKKTSETQLSVWHYPSPGTNAEQWETFKQDNEIVDTYDWDEYNNDGQGITEHVTTTVLIRDANGEWTVKSQQSRGPVGGGDALLQIGKVYGRRLNVGEEEQFDV